MTIKKQLHPDAAPGAGGGGNGKPNSTRNIPEADVDFMDLSKNVATNWLANKQIRWSGKQLLIFKNRRTIMKPNLPAEKAPVVCCPARRLRLSKWISRLILQQAR